MTYQPRHSIIGVEIDGCEFTTDTQLMPWAPRVTPDGIEMHQRCVVRGVKINGVWFDACAMGDDFIEEMEYEIECMPLNAEGDIDEAALRMGKAEVEKRAAALSQPAPAQPDEMPAHLRRSVNIVEVGRRHFGQPLPAAWFAAARELLGAAQEPMTGAIDYSPNETAAPAQAVPLTAEKIADIVREHLTAVYVCTRVWEAWSVGTMTEDDFEPASETDMSDEIAAALIAHGITGEPNANT